MYSLLLEKDNCTHEISYRNTEFEKIRKEGYVYVDETAPVTNSHRGECFADSPIHLYFELKINQNADVALRQIDEKGYAAPFASDGRKLFKIGVNFSTDKKKINDWKIA